MIKMNNPTFWIATFLHFKVDIYNYLFKTLRKKSETWYLYKMSWLNKIYKYQKWENKFHTFWKDKWINIFFIIKKYFKWNNRNTFIISLWRRYFKWYRRNSTFIRRFISSFKQKNSKSKYRIKPKRYCRRINRTFHISWYRK